MKKSNKKILLSTLITGAIAPAILSVVSCSNNSNDLNFWNNIGALGGNVETNNSGKELTAYEFNELAKTNGFQKALLDYTNFSSLEVAISNIGGIVEVIDSYFLTDGKNSISFSINIKNKSTNEVRRANFFIIGFKNDYEKVETKVDEIVNDFKSNVNLSAKNVDNYITSEDVWNKWYSSDDISKNNVLFNYINGFPLDILVNGTYRGARVEIKNENINSEEEAKQYVWWNENEENNNIKGDSLYIKLKFVVSTDYEGDDTISAERYLDVKINGFSSFNNKFNSLSNDFVSNKGYTNIINNSTTPEIIANEYNSASSNEDKINIIKKYISLPEKNILNNGLIWDINSVNASNISDTTLVINYNLSWNGLLSNQDILISPFLSKDSFVSQKIEELRNLQLTPSEKGASFSSEEIVKQWHLDPSSINDNILDLPKDETGIQYVINNVLWNNDANITERGSTLFIDIKLIYNKKEYDVRLKPITGFIIPYNYANNYFLEKISKINLTIKEDKKGKDVINVVNNENLNEWIDGMPEINDDFYITNLKVIHDETNGKKGILEINFTYNYNAKYKGESINYTFNSVINKKVSGFQTYASKSNINFSNILSDITKLNGKNYFDTLYVSGTRPSDWLTSYFAPSHSSGSDLNSEDTFNKFRRLFKMPNDQFGIKFTFIEIKYIETDPSLSHTQMRIKYRIEALYTEETNQILKPIERNEIISGFFDPFNDEIRSHSIKTRGQQFNKIYSKYRDVPSFLKMGDANWQASWVSWGWYEPLSYWVDYIENKNHGSKNKFDQVAIPAASYAFDQYSKNWKNVQIDKNFFTEYKTYWRVGNHDSDGVVVVPITVNATIKTIARDVYGNSAEGKYKDLKFDNLELFLHWDNNWWK